MEDFVTNEYADTPYVLETWRAIPLKIIKTDFFRLLVIYKKGGIYADIDTLCLQPMSQLIYPNDEMIIAPENYLPGTASGLYRVTPVDSEVLHYCNWAFAGMAGHPLLEEVIKEASRRILQDFAQIDIKNIACWTAGPCALTNATRSYLYNSTITGSSRLRIVNSVLFGADVWKLRDLIGQFRLNRVQFISHIYGSQNLKEFYKSWLQEENENREKIKELAAAQKTKVTSIPETKS